MSCLPFYLCPSFYQLCAVSLTCLADDITCCARSHLFTVAPLAGFESIHDEPCPSVFGRASHQGQFVRVYQGAPAVILGAGKPGCIILLDVSAAALSTSDVPLHHSHFDPFERFPASITLGTLFHIFMPTTFAAAESCLLSTHMKTNCTT